MRLSRDKVNVLARAVSDVLKQMDEVEFIEDPNTIRQETRKILEALLMQEARIDVSARQKIESQKRTILEGSQEWDILYRKYYNEEVRVILEAYSDEMNKTGANYQEMFRKVKTELVRKYKAVL